jgi:hypothetical protein
MNFNLFGLMMKLNLRDTNIKSLWLRMRHEDPAILGKFENFIVNVSEEIRKSKTDFIMLETVLQRYFNF